MLSFLSWLLKNLLTILNNLICIQKLKSLTFQHIQNYLNPTTTFWVIMTKKWRSKMSYIILPGAHTCIYIYTMKTEKILILFILRRNFGKNFRKNWWYPCKIERMLDGETHEGSKINLNYIFLLLIYMKLVLILNHWILLLIAKEQPALSIWPTVQREYHRSAYHDYSCFCSRVNY